MTAIPAFLACCLLAQAPSIDRDLAGLAASDKSVSLEAAGAIEERGKSALHALRTFESTAPPEAKVRARSLIDLIEDQRLLRATPVRLDLRETPLPDAVGELARSSGYRIELRRGVGAVQRSRKVTLQTDPGVGFWEALDRLGQAGKVAQVAGAFGELHHDGASIVLADEDRPTPPTSYAGPYRVRLKRLERERRTTLATKATDSRPVGSMTATIEVAAEPGIIPTPSGPAVVIEAIDDLGQDLTARPFPNSGSPSWKSLRARDLEPLQVGGDASFEDAIPLHLPERPGTAIRRVRGYAPIQAIARTGDTLEIPLDAPPEREHTLGGVSIRVISVQSGGPQSVVRLSILGATQPRPAVSAGRRQASLSGFNPPFRAEECLLLLDADGRPLPLMSTPVVPVNPLIVQTGPVELTLKTIANPGLASIRPGSEPQKPPVRLIYARVVGVSTEVPFEFADLPMP
ncbi:hypothetical protein EP7_001581 [Isosphaeraceae bacterium EP7]